MAQAMLTETEAWFEMQADLDPYMAEVEYDRWLYGHEDDTEVM